MVLRRRNRTIEIFSISALDLFASALGAFILIAVILFPYYLKRHDADAQIAQVQAELRETQEALRQARERADQASREAQAASQQADAAARAAAAEARAREAEARVAALEKSLAQARAAGKASSVFALLGITTQAKSFVLLIDMSSSMQEYADVMVGTVERLLAPMEGDIRLTIIGYNAPFGPPRLYPWTRQGQLVAMTPQGKRQAQAFVRQLSAQFAGKTPTHAALIEALRYPVESIILLSDGAPTDNDPRAIVADITAANRGRMEINCVAIGDYNKAPVLVAFLQALARENGGDFTGVSG